MLIIGRCKPKKGNKFGGVVISFETFVEYLKNKGWHIDIIDLSWRNYTNKFLFIVKVYSLIIIKILFRKDKKVSFHGTTSDFTYFSPLVVFLSKIKGKRVTLRAFGGSFDLYYNGLTGVRKNIVHYAISNADYVFLQTKSLIKEFLWLNNTIWLPTHRNVEATDISDKTYSKKFVFLSHIKATKGVNAILEAITRLPEDYEIHLYGPLKNYSPPKHLSKVFDKHYCGVVQPNEVLKTMKQYDVLLLPTYHEGEGYPGAILEAYSQGLPVISTHWRSIPEIVLDGKTGFLIKPKSVSELVEAIEKINPSNYVQLALNANMFFKEFQRDKVLERIIKYL